MLGSNRASSPAICVMFYITSKTPLISFCRVRWLGCCAVLGYLVSIWFSQPLFFFSTHFWVVKKGGRIVELCPFCRHVVHSIRVNCKNVQAMVISQNILQDRIIVLASTWAYTRVVEGGSLFPFMLGGLIIVLFLFSK